MMRVLIISDIHANPWALNAVFDEAGSTDQVLCAGDIVNYGPDPASAIAMVRNCNAVAVSGNHDHAVASRADPRASPAKAALANAMCAWTRRQLCEDDLLWLAALNQHAVWSTHAALFAMVHATPIDPLFDYRLTPTASDELVELLMGEMAADVLVVGHTHLPLLRRWRDTQIINPGSVGQPLDGDTRAAYGIWEDGAVRLCRVEYDQRPVLKSLDNIALFPPLRENLQRILRTGRA
jgi:putative phosphoesterase